MAERTCTIARGGGPLTVRLTATNLLNAGARTGLFGASNQKVEEWTMTTGDDGVEEHATTADPGALDGGWLQWVVRTCSRHPGADQGTITVEVLQGGQPAPMAPPASYDRTVPQCSTGQALRITDFCRFRAT
jgi:hypothetical protein